MKIYIKGGPWKNVEDEILKAAIMKYGKNQWDRIASLLPRKSSKQCKSRWYEWLDPSVKRTPWTRDEEEKLLRLVKIMPTQWRTIAPIVGRTPYQCIEHYELLLDKYQERESEFDADDDPRRLRPGEVDYMSEHKPCLPDPVDMAEDEKEMLSEARARMANTLGKKAKRQARERQLEEQRRLASLKKRRELKAAGIFLIQDSVHRRRKLKRTFKKINFLKEIPFQKRTPIGLHDVSHEKIISSRPKRPERSLELVEGRMNDEREQKGQLSDRAELEKKRERDFDSFLHTLSRTRDHETGEDVIESHELKLPEPQTSDELLQQLAKAGGAVSDVSMGSDGRGGQRSVTSRLLASYSATPSQRRGPTPFGGGGVGAGRAAPGTMARMRTPMVRDSIRSQTQEVQALRRMQTPLLRSGDEPPVVRPTPAARSLSSAPRTPNPYVSAQRQIQTPRNTPYRDELSINEATSLVMESRKAERRRLRLRREALRQQFRKNLPAPKQSSYGLRPVFPQEEEVEERAPLRIEDAEEIARRKSELRNRKRASLMQMRSAPVRLDLPRPRRGGELSADGDGDIFMFDEDLLEAEKVIQKEASRFANFDFQHFPPKVMRRKKKRRIPAAGDGFLSDPFLLEFEHPDILRAREIIDREFESLSRQAPPQAQFNSIWKQCYLNLVVGRSLFPSGMPIAEKKRLLKANYEFFLARFRERQEDVEKLRRQVEILTRGHRKRDCAALGRIRGLHSRIDESERKLSSFLVISEMETMAIPRRLLSLEERLEMARERERELQAEYDDLRREEEELLAFVDE